MHWSNSFTNLSHAIISTKRFKVPLFSLVLFLSSVWRLKHFVEQYSDYFCVSVYVFVVHRFFFHFRQHMYIEWKRKKKRLRLIYIPSAEISSFIKICGLWFVNISNSISYRVVPARIFRAISPFHEQQFAYYQRCRNVSDGGIADRLRIWIARRVWFCRRRHSLRNESFSPPSSLRFGSSPLRRRARTTLDWSFDNVIGTPAVSRPSASVVRRSIRFDIGVTAAGAAGADISSLLSSERRCFQLASLNIEQTAKLPHLSTIHCRPLEFSPWSSPFHPAISFAAGSWKNENRDNDNGL